MPERAPADVAPKYTPTAAATTPTPSSAYATGRSEEPFFGSSVMVSAGFDSSLGVSFASSVGAAAGAAFGAGSAFGAGFASATSAGALCFTGRIADPTKP